MKHIRNYHLRIERWRDVTGFEGFYQASTTGKTMNKRTGKILKPVIVNGYCRVTLFKDGIRKRYFVHRLVAETFIPNPENKPEIDHINTITNDNRVENLRWVTRSENQKNPLTVIKKSKSHKKKIIQISNNDYIKIWDSAIDIERELGYLHTAIANVCNGRRKTAYGYIWKYA